MIVRLLALVVAVAAFLVAGVAAGQLGTPAGTRGPGSSATGDLCDNAISPATARGRVGQRVVVKGPVADAHFAVSGDGQPTFLYLGAPYPDPSRLTVVIWGRDRSRFPRPPEEAYASTTICVVGTVETTPDGLGMEVEAPGSIAVP